MAKAVAGRWVAGVSRDEYRFTLFGLGTPEEARKFASLLRSWRDGKIKVASMDPIPDLGVKESGDVLELWSSDLQGLKKLATWAESRGLDTSFIW
jgi:hypothetical protein